MSMATQYEENTIACIYSGNIHVIIVTQRVLQSYKVKTEGCENFFMVLCASFEAHCYT